MGETNKLRQLIDEGGFLVKERSRFLNPDFALGLMRGEGILFIGKEDQLFGTSVHDMYVEHKKVQTDAACGHNNKLIANSNAKSGLKGEE